MSLPGVTLPGTAPPFQAAGHAIDPGDVYDNVPRGAGANRKRRVFTVQNRLVAVEWFLEQAVMQDVWAWFETGLDVGNRPFAAPVANEGPGIQWWTAKWKAPFTVDPVNLGDRVAWHVSGALVLSGEGQDTYTAAADLAAEVIVVLDADATVIGAFDLSAEVAVVLDYGAALAAEIAVSLAATASLGEPADLEAEVAVALSGAGALSASSGETDILATQIFGG